MSWSMAVIVRGSFTERGYDRERIGDVLYKLVEAPDAEAAYEKAIELGQATVDTIQDDDLQEVSLRFLGLADLMEIGAEKPGDGTEVYSRALGSRPNERIVEKQALTAFRPWEI